MYYKFFFIFLTLGTLLPSCFIMDPVFEPKGEEPPMDIEEIAEQNIKAYIKSIKEDEIYKPYGFSKLVVVKPIEIVELEKKQKKYALNKRDSSLFHEIEKQKTYNHDNNIERSAKMEHFFTLTSENSTITVLEVEYILNDTLWVRKSIPKIILEIPFHYEQALDYYFNEYTIFVAQSYSEGKKLSHSFYSYFKNQLETYTSVTDKSNFLKHTLDICKMVKLKGAFNQEYIAETLVKKHIKTKRTDITNYKSIKFSELYETRNTENNDLIGYYFFHQFVGEYEQKKDTNVVIVEFSPYFEIDQILQLENSFESYSQKQ